MTDFSYLDVCSGYSAATLAFEGFGWRCAGHAEIDPFASAIIAHHHGATAPMRMPDPAGPIIGLSPKDEARERKRRHVAIKSIPHYYWGNGVPNFGDFTTIQEEDVGPVDLLIGGTPCQSFSQAGKRLGLDDPRGNLTLEFLALARRLRSRWVAWENVPGFLSHDEGRTPGTFFRLLGELGYGWAYRVIDAQYIRVDGLEGAVPQRRRRVIVVGCLGNASAAASVLFDRESLRGDPRPSRRAVKDVAGTIRASAAKRGGIQDESDGDGLVVARDVAPTIDASYGRLQGCSGQDARHGYGHLMVTKGLPPVASPLRAGGEASGWRDDLDNGTFLPVPPVANTISAERGRSPSGDGTDSTLIPVIPFDTTQITSPHNGSNPQVGDPCHALAAEGHPPAVAFKASHYTRDKDGEPREVAPPLTADTDKGDQDTLILVKEAIGFNSVQDPDVSGTISGPLNAQTPQAQAICIHADAIGRDGKAKADSPDAEGKMRKRDAGLGISEDASFNLTTGAPHAIAVQESEPADEPFVFQSRIARNGRGQPESVVPTLNGVNAGETSDMRPLLADPTAGAWRVRRLTPVECERLQGVPDFYTHIELRKRQRSIVPADVERYWLDQRPDLTLEQLRHLCADAPRYRVLGNSYARNFARWVGWGIKMVDEAVFGQ